MTISRPSDKAAARRWSQRTLDVLRRRWQAGDPPSEIVAGGPYMRDDGVTLDPVTRNCLKALAKFHGWGSPRGTGERGGREKPEDALSEKWLNDPRRRAALALKAGTEDPDFIECPFDRAGPVRHMKPKRNGRKPEFGP